CHRSRQGHIKPDLDDLVFPAQNGLAHSDHPRMRYQVNEAADPLGMDFNVVALWPTSHRAVGALQRLMEQELDVVTQLLRPLPRERRLQRNDAVAVEPSHDWGNLVIRGRMQGMLIAFVHGFE